MSSGLSGARIRLRPRHNAIHVSRGRTVLATSPEGTIHPQTAREGLYVYQTRMLSRYRWTMDGEEPQLSAQSPVEQHSWLAYYYIAPPNCQETPAAECNPLQQTIELKVSRVVGEGLHEDIEVTNHTQAATSIRLALEADADFAARAEVRDGRSVGPFHRHAGAAWTLALCSPQCALPRSSPARVASRGEIGRFGGGRGACQP